MKRICVFALNLLLIAVIAAPFLGTLNAAVSNAAVSPGRFDCDWYLAEVDPQVVDADARALFKLALSIYGGAGSEGAATARGAAAGDSATGGARLRRNSPEAIFINAFEREFWPVVQQLHKTNADIMIARKSLGEDSSWKEILVDLERTYVAEQTQLAALKLKFAPLAAKVLFGAERMAVVTIRRGERLSLDLTPRLADMYVNFARKQGWQVRVLEGNAGSTYRRDGESITLEISGDAAYALLNLETGIHKMFIAQEEATSLYQGNIIGSQRTGGTSFTRRTSVQVGSSGHVYQEGQEQVRIYDMRRERAVAERRFSGDIGADLAANIFEVLRERYP